MPSKQRARLLPDLRRCHCTHLSFCLSGLVDEDLLESLSRPEGGREPTRGQSVFLGCEYSRQGETHHAILVVDPLNDEEGPGWHIVVQCEPRGFPEDERDLIVVHGRLMPSGLVGRIQVREVARLIASVDFAEESDATVYLQARFEYPLEGHRPYIDLPIRQEGGIEIRGMRFASDAPSTAVIVDLGDEEGGVLYVSLWSHRELAPTLPICEMALQAACSDIEPFVTRCGEEKAQ